MANSVFEEEFLSWARGLTKGSSFPCYKSVLTQENILCPLKVESFSPAARDLIHRVRVPVERDFIRRNLRYASVRKYFFEGFENPLKSPSNQNFTCDLTEARMNLSAEAKLLKEIAIQEAKLIKEEENLKHQINLLDIACKKQEAKTSRMNSWLSALDQLLAECSTLSPQDESIKLDAACNDMKTILMELQELKSQLLKANKQDFHEMKLLLWYKVETLLNSHKVSTLMKRLLAFTIKETSTLDSATQQIDLASDARELSLRYSKGSFIEEVGSSQGVAETMESLLVEMSGKHVNLHFSNLNKQQETSAMVQILKNNKTSVEKVIAELHPDTALGSELLTLYDLILQMAGLKASLAATARLTQSLDVRAGMALKAKRDVTAKFEKIHQFEDKVRNGLAKLKGIALSLNLHQEELDEENRNVTAFIDQTMENFALPVTHPDRLLMKEVDMVLQLPCDAFTLDSAPADIVSFGSLNLEPDYISNVIPYLTTWDQFLHMVQQKQLWSAQKKAFLSTEIWRFESVLNTIRKGGISTLKLKDLHKSLKSHDQTLESEILSIFANNERSYSALKEMLKQLKKAIDEWWTQPGPIIREYLKKGSSMAGNASQICL